MKPVCHLFRNAKSLPRGVAALLVLAALATLADAQPTIQPGEVLTYFFESNDKFDRVKRNESIAGQRIGVRARSQSR